MVLRPLAIVAVVCAVCLLSGCATVNPKRDYERTSQHVAAATGTESLALPDDDALLSEKVNELLAAGLTADEAVQLCLLNNPRVKSAFFAIGMARADLVQSGLFRNPSLFLSTRLPDGGGLSNIELVLGQNIADLWLIPIRKKAAQGELERQILSVAREVSAVALDTRAAYFKAVGAEREFEIAVENRDVANQLLDIARARQQAGVGSEIDVNLARAGFMETDLAVRTTKLAAFEAKRELVVLLGLRTPPGDLQLAETLPDPPKWALSQERLLALASSSRLDLQAASRVVDAAAARVRQEKLNVFANVEVGVAMEREERPPASDRNLLFDTLHESVQAGQLTAPELLREDDGGQDVIVGPTLSLDLPIFDQNQAQIAKAEFAYRQAILARETLTLEIVQEARTAYERATTVWDVSNYYRDQVVPLLQYNLELSREAYRAGKLSFLSVLEAQQQLLATRAKHVQALRAAAVVVVELEKAIGQPMGKILADEPRPDAPKSDNGP